MKSTHPHLRLVRITDSSALGSEGAEAHLGGQESASMLLLDRYVTWCRASGHRPQTIRLRLHWLNRVARDLDLSAATSRDLVDWLGSHEWAPETRRSARSALKSFYSWATDDDELHTDPTTKLPAVRVPGGQPRPAPTNLLQAALLVASQRDELILALAAFAGLRRSEIASLRWTDVQWHGLRITGKGGKVRTVPMLDRLDGLLAAERQRRELGEVGPGFRYRVDPSSPYVLPSHQGGHVSPYTVGKILSDALGAGWTGHTLRHRFATLAYGVDRDLLTVQQLLGHSKPETTARYTKTPDGAALAAVQGAAA